MNKYKYYTQTRDENRNHNPEAVSTITANYDNELVSIKYEPCLNLIEIVLYCMLLDKIHAH